MPIKLHPPSHYNILSLPEPTTGSSGPTLEEIKLAYKRALLIHHPDKKAASSHRTSNPKATIDQITQAYRTLSHPSARAAYDRTFHLSLRNEQSQALKDPGNPLSYSGLEIIDLDDMHHDAQAGFYYHSCRCGRERTYTIRDEDLEAHADEGEISVGCEGCSLWIRVEFLVKEEGK